MAQLTTHPLPADIEPARPVFAEPAAVLDDPALVVMTDLAHRRAITSRRDTTVFNAEHLMRTAGVRLLFVVDPDGAIKGIVSYRDLVSERALTAAAQEGVKRIDLALAAVMTPAPHVEALDYAAVGKAKVREIIEIMRERGRQHMLVTETDAAHHASVRGIFSATQIGRQLGLEIEASGVVQSFAEFERVISSG